MVDPSGLCLMSHTEEPRGLLLCVWLESMVQRPWKVVWLLLTRSIQSHPVILLFHS